MAEFVDYDQLNRDLNLTTGSSLGSITNSFLPTILQLAGVILFGMLVMGGFTMLAGAADKESQEKGKKMITSSLTGFAIIFLSYWIAQILQVIFKINILS
jgi:Zn-dependent protease with chaperone function